MPSMNCPECGSPTDLLGVINPDVVVRCERGHVSRVGPELAGQEDGG